MKVETNSKGKERSYKSEKPKEFLCIAQDQNVEKITKENALSAFQKHLPFIDFFIHKFSIPTLYT